MLSPLFSVEDDQLVQFVIKGPPVPKEPAWAFQANGKVRFCNKTHTKELHFQDAVKETMGGILPNGTTYFESKFLEVTIAFCFCRPDYHFVGGDRARQSIKQDILAFPSQSDVDNLAKFVLDSLNGVLFHDDSRVVTLLVTKGWCRDSLSPGSTAIRIRAVDPSYVCVL